MSQAGANNQIGGGGGSTIVETLTGNSGGAVSPTANNINTVGTGSITVVGNPGTSTLTAQLTGLTNHDVLVGAGTATITSVSPSTAGFVLTSNGVSADPSFQAASASGAITSITGNSGGAEVPSSGNFNILGTGSITVAGSANTETVQLTGLTAHNILLGEGTATVGLVAPTANTGAVLQNNSGADPTYSTATYPSTTTINDILYSSANNTVDQITAGNNGVLISGTTGVPSWLPDGTTGQILTATTGSPPSWASPAGSGTVTSVSVVSANGLAGTVATATTTPAITLTTTATGVLSGNGTAISGSAITQHDVLVGGATNAITSVAPSATSGVPLISQGASSDPAFGTAVVAGGGTGATSFNINGPVIANTTTTGALASVTLTSQQFLVGNSGAPTAKALSVVRQVFTSTGTYTPTSGMLYCDIEVVGGGGGGGGSANSGAASACAAGGGGGGGYARGTFSAATIGASKAVAIGAAGAAGTAGANTGGTGGTTSVGSTLISATGGIGGVGCSAFIGALGGAGGAGSSGDFQTSGSPGGNGSVLVSGVNISFTSGFGGSTYFGGGAQGTNGSTAGNAAASYGGGGSGAADSNTGTHAGGAGAKGVVIVTEYVIA